MLCQPRSASWRQRPWISRGWRTRTRTTSVSSDSAAECATVNLVRKQNSNAPVSQPVRLRLRGKHGAAAPLSPCLPMTLAGHVTIRGGDIISVLCVGRETRSCRRAVRQKRMPRIKSVSEMAVTCWHRCRGAQRETWQRPSLFWVPTADRARTMLWTSTGSLTGERRAKIRRSLACETCN